MIVPFRRRSGVNSYLTSAKPSWTPLLLSRRLRVMRLTKKLVLLARDNPDAFEVIEGVVDKWLSHDGEAS